jgi:hypothetical protein
MRLLLGLLAYLIAIVAIGGGGAAVLYPALTPGAQTTAAQQHAPQISPRIQIWLERKAEGVTFAEREKAAVLAERERTDALRARLAAMPEPVAVTSAGDSGRKRPERERVAAAKESAKRDAIRRMRQLEAQPVYGYAPAPRRFADPQEFLTRRDRYGY